MKKIHKILYSIFAIFATRHAYAASTACSVTSCTSGFAMEYGATNCTTVKSTTCYKPTYGTSVEVFKYTSCATCPDGFKIQSKTDLNMCSGAGVTYNDCVPCNTNCLLACTSTSWTTTNTKYQSRTYSTCNKCSGSCVNTTQYRCASGFYGSPTSTSSGCYDCPTENNLKGISTAGQNTYVTQCFYESGGIVTETSGFWKYTENCFYSS